MVKNFKYVPPRPGFNLGKTLRDQGVIGDKKTNTPLVPTRAEIVMKQEADIRKMSARNIYRE